MLAPAILVGINSNIYRVASVFASLEFESYQVGTAGIVGNILRSMCVPVTAAFSRAFFGQVMTPLAVLGASLVVCATFFVFIVKVLRRHRDEKRNKKKEENMECLTMRQEAGDK